MLICLPTLVGSDFIDIWRSAVGVKNGLKIQCFDHNVNKKTLQIATPHWPFDRFSWKFAQRYFSRVQKIWWERNFEFFIFSLFIAQKPLETLYFYHNFDKKPLKITTPHSLFDRFSWKFAQRYFSRMQKIWWERIFEFSLFLLFIARQSSKNSENHHFCRFLGYK